VAITQVWSRDLYEVATALEALGDRSAASGALDYLFNVQQKPTAVSRRTPGSMAANRGALQLDEVALPLVLAYQLGRTDRSSWLKHIKPAADFIVVHARRRPGALEEKPDFPHPPSRLRLPDWFVPLRLADCKKIRSRPNAT